MPKHAPNPHVYNCNEKQTNSVNFIIALFMTSCNPVHGYHYIEYAVSVLLQCHTPEDKGMHLHSHEFQMLFLFTVYKKKIHVSLLYTIHI
jgi:hypothetical protein